MRSMTSISDELERLRRENQELRAEVHELVELCAAWRRYLQTLLRRRQTSHGRRPTKRDRELLRKCGVKW